MKLQVPLGSDGNPVILKTYSEERAQKIIALCEQHALKFIIGLEADEDITDLEKAIKQKIAPDNMYSPCPCGSRAKYKFCCMKRPIQFDF